MGPRTVRITAEDFLVPAGFGGLKLAERTAGQIGGVSLNLIATDGRTIFGPIYQQVPLRVLPAFSFPDEPASLVYLINPTAGLLDGDGHLVEVDAGQGTRAVITGQSATRVHPAVKGFSTQQWRIRAEAGSQLVILPGPNIPFRGCRYHQRADIELEGDARLTWGDIWTPGRYARIGELAEFYEFQRVIQELSIRREGRLVYRDHFTWDGPWDEATARWYLGPGPAGRGAMTGTGSLFVTGPVEPASMGAVGSLERAILPLECGDTLIRWCGPVPDLTADLVTTAFRLAGTWSGCATARPWLIGSSHLVPNHWFSVRSDFHFPRGS
jgi:urease accessory protein